MSSEFTDATKDQVPANHGIVLHNAQNSSETVPAPKTLDELKKIVRHSIANARQNLKEAAEALREIKARELWRAEGFASFDEFCTANFGFGAKQAYKVMNALPIMEELAHGDAIVNEAQARELKRVPKEKRDEVLESAIKVADDVGQPLTAKVIHDTAVDAGLIYDSATTPTSVAGTASKHSCAGVRLRNAWKNASLPDRKSFIADIRGEIAEWHREERPTASPVHNATYSCSECGETFDSLDDAVTIYECGECGQTFSENDSPNGKNQCPECNRFAAKLFDQGCPECGQGELILETPPEEAASSQNSRQTPAETDQRAESQNQRPVSHDAKNSDQPESSPKPNSVQIGEVSKPIAKWNEVLLHVANWILAQGLALPAVSFIQAEPSQFRASARIKSLSNGGYIEVGDSKSGLLRKSRRLLDACGQANVQIHATLANGEVIDI